jgi:hypothetical protein
VKNRIKSILFCTFILSLSAFGSPDISQADSSQITGSGAAQVSVSFRIVIPPSLYLQVQSAPSDTIQAIMLSKDGIETGNQVGEMVRLDVQAYGNVPKKGTIHFSSNSRQSMGNVSESPYPYHRESLWMPNGIIATSNDMGKKTRNVSSPSRGIYTYHFSDNTNSSVASPVEYQSFILCSP